jgi:hypothetical protein
MRSVLLIALAMALPGATAAVRASDPSVELSQLHRVQRAVDTLRERLGLTAEVVAELVPAHPRLVGVAPRSGRDRSYRLTFEADFVGELTDGELDAAIAHELGHVWIFGHHPYLHTEQLANAIAERVVSREALEAMYLKVDARGGRKVAVSRFSDDTH